MNKKSGVSLASLMIATILIILLTTTVTISVNKVAENANKISFASEINSLQMSIDSYYLANKEYPVLDESIILDISEIDDKEAFSDENVINNKVILNKIDYEKIDYVSLKYGMNTDDSDVYGVSESTGRVYYAKGIKFGNTTYFNLTQDLKTLLSNGKNSNIYKNTSVIFMPSNIEWTNNPVKLVVKVPKNYTNILVQSALDTYSVTSEDENYYIYNIEKQGNYEVEVNYLDENKVEKTAKYNVKNFDIEKPELKIDEHIILSEDYNNEIYGYYNITSSNDNDSGVKEIKYDYGKIEDNVNNYFKSNGEIVIDNRIIIKRGYEYITVYIEDNATNYNVVYIKI